MHLRKDSEQDPSEQTSKAYDALSRQSYYIANELVRIWAAKFGRDEQRHLTGLKQLPEALRVTIAGDIARTTGVPRGTILRMLKTRWLPSTKTLIAIATGLDRKLLLECRGMAPGRLTTVTAELADPNGLMKAVGPWVTRLKDDTTGRQLTAHANIADQTLVAAEGGFRVTKVETLFRIATALGYDLKLRFQPQRH